MVVHEGPRGGMYRIVLGKKRYLTQSEQEDAGIAYGRGESEKVISHYKIPKKYMKEPACKPK